MYVSVFTCIFIELQMVLCQTPIKSCFSSLCSFLNLYFHSRSMDFLPGLSSCKTPINKMVLSTPLIFISLSIPCDDPFGKLIQLVLYLLQHYQFLSFPIWQSGTRSVKMSQIVVVVMIESAGILYVLSA